MIVLHKKIQEQVWLKSSNTSRKIVLNDLSKKIVNVHNDGINVHNDLILSLWTFAIFLDKSFRIGFSTSARFVLTR